MKTNLYTITKIPGTFDRNKALELCKKIMLTRLVTAQYVNSLIKIGMKKASNSVYYAVNTVKDYRISLDGTVKKGTTEIKRGEYIETLSGVYPEFGEIARTKKSIVSYIREDRRQRKYMRDPIGLHLKSGYWMQKQIAKRYSSLDDYKRPKEDSRYLGIEIECIIPTDSDIKRLMLPYAKWVSLAHDGSIDASEFNDSDHSSDNCDDPDNCGESHEETYEGREIRVLVKESELNEVLPKICEVLNDIGAKVNKSCGLHVHFDMRNTNQEDRNLIYAKLYHALPLLTQLVPKSRLKNQYCKRNNRSIPNYNGNRYKMINPTSYHKHSTFEIRMFNSTTNADKIINWINLLQHIIGGSVFLRCPSSFKKAQTLWTLPDTLVSWAEQRREKFKSLLPENQADTQDAIQGELVHV